VAIGIGLMKLVNFRRYGFTWPQFAGGAVAGLVFKQINPEDR